MSKRSRSTLFLIEQLIVIAIFAVCAAACVSILTVSFISARESSDMSGAILTAENAAESFKAVSGDIDRAAAILGGSRASENNEDKLIVHYNERWQVVGESDAQFTLRIVRMNDNPQQSLISAQLSVENITGEQILSFPVIARAATELAAAGGG
jgi:type II secretory pathway pseudopilin PulG